MKTFFTTIKNSFYLILLILPLWSPSAFGQEQFLRKLDLPIYQLNSKNPNIAGCSKSNYNSKESQCIFEISNNDLFKSMILLYDELSELESIIYSVNSERKFEKSLDDLLSYAKNEYGNFNTLDTKNGVAYAFVSKNFELLINKSKSSLETSTILLRSINNVKIVSSYDDFNKSTYLYPINYRYWVKSNNDLEYKIGFSGFKESKSIYIQINSSSSDWKFIESIQILLSNGEVISKTLTTSRDIVNNNFGVQTKEVGLAKLEDSEILKIIGSEIVKMRINGKYQSDLSLSSDQLLALKMVYESVFKN